MRARPAAALLALACWAAWPLLFSRLAGEPASALLLGLLGLGLVRLLRGPGGERRVAPEALAVVLAAYALAVLAGPGLLRLGAAAAGGALVAAAALGPRAPRLPLLGTALLALPVLPTLDFLLAWPLRRLSALLTAGLLQAQGVPVGVEGVALSVGGEFILFDAPCSGIRMLWAALLLTSLLALIGRVGPWRYARGLVLATGLAVAGNALRAASLFHLERGATPLPAGPIVHEVVGILSFALLAAAALALRPRLAGARA